MFVVVGLGNPGRKYSRNRHNIGFMVLDAIVKAQNSKLTCPQSLPARLDYARALRAWRSKRCRREAQKYNAKVKIKELKWNFNKKLKAEIAEVQLSTVKGNRSNVFLVKPYTFMNRSGESVKTILYYFKFEAKKGHFLFVVHDELDLPLGALQIRHNISSGGHKGVESIIDYLGTKDFTRFRIGINPGKVFNSKNKKDYLLTNFTRQDMRLIKPAISTAAEAVVYAIENGIEKAMNKYN